MVCGILTQIFRGVILSQGVTLKMSAPGVTHPSYATDCTRLQTAQRRAGDSSRYHSSNQRPPAGAHRCQALDFRLSFYFFKRRKLRGMWLGKIHFVAR